MSATKRVTSKRGASGVQFGDAEARARILQGATQVFAELGVRGASVEDILKAAGVARRTFYRQFDSKESVAAALYHVGTENLLGVCALAVSQGQTPLERVSGCIDAHLVSARELGRLVFVLGGEAHRQESLLHARRMEVHEALVALFETATKGQLAVPVDPLLFRALVLALEGVTRMVLESGDEGRRVSSESIERARRVMVHLARASLGLT